MKRIAIIGAGGCAREIAWLIEEIAAETTDETSKYTVAGFLVSDATRIGPYDSPILGDFDWLESNEIDALALGIGTPAVRLELSEHLKRRFPSIPWPALVHPNIRWQQRSMQLSEGVILSGGCTATVNVKFDPFCYVNICCTIGHEVVVGRGCVINPMTTIAGGVVLGSGVLVGTGAQILQYLRVGDGAQVGAGAVVFKDVKSGTTVVGFPAVETVTRSRMSGKHVDPINSSSFEPARRDATESPDQAGECA